MQQRWVPVVIEASKVQSLRAKENPATGMSPIFMVSCFGCGLLVYVCVPRHREAINQAVEILPYSIFPRQTRRQPVIANIIRIEIYIREAVGPVALLHFAYFTATGHVRGRGSFLVSSCLHISRGRTVGRRIESVREAYDVHCLAVRTACIFSSCSPLEKASTRKQASKESCLA